jgi:hypothetical protein
VPTRADEVCVAPDFATVSIAGVAARLITDAERHHFVTVR